MTDSARLEPFRWLLGKWEGKGSGGFPTMPDFEFEDQMMFTHIEEAFEAEPLIHFEEVAFVYEEGKRLFKHWESGFIKPASDNRIQFYVSHNTGRIEVFYGSFRNVDLDKRSFEITFQSDFLRNGEGLARAITSSRTLTFDGEALSYVQSMSTQSVAEETSHIKATLRRD